MGQIIKRKKKGRPPKSDLAAKPRDSDPEPESRVRRSLRRRNVRYNFVDYDDFIEDDYFEEEEEDDDERRKEKKVKLVVKLNQRARAGHARESGASESEDEEEEDEDDESERRKLVKKRRISGCDEDEDEEQGGADDGEARGLAKGNLKELDSPPGTPSGTLSVIPLPDKKKLEFILDKLQKKDTYGVYAEPVDPEELPDYHDVIKHPMDFSTVRKKLANGSYSTLDQFESDVFLICSNAMRYNAPDTIYHKQARTIQELGQKKFHKLRIDYERSEQELKVEQKSKIDFECPEKEVKSEQRTKSNFLVKKQTKKPLPRSLQEPVGSDFSAGATLAGDLPNVSTANQGGSHERAINYDGILESSTVFTENNVDKSEDLSIGKGLQSKLWRKPFTVDENRRATYNISNQPAVKVDSIFTTFEGETRQLVAVGLHAENSYARSLARFAATLGPIAWKVASQRIEQAIPSGCKFGRGWVGEYEPPPTPVLLVENRLSKESSAVTNLQRTTDSRKDEAPIKRAVPTRENVVNNSGIEVKPSLSCADTVSSPVASAGLRSNSAVNASHQRQNPVSRNSTGSGNRVVKQFELNSLPSANQCNADYIAEKKLVDKSETAASRSGEIVTKNLNHPQKEVSEAAAVSRSKETLPSSPQPASFRQADTNGVVLRGLGNGKIASSSSDNIRMSNTSSGLHSEMPRPPAFFLRQDQGLSDPVQLMRMLAEKAQQQQNSSQNVGNNAPSMTPVPSIHRDGGANAATTAASVWMSIGAGGFKQAAENSSSPRSQNTAESSFNSPRELHSPMPRARGEFPASSAAQFQHERNSVPPFMQAPIGLTNEAQLSNRPMVFSQLMNANLSRFQPQMPWRGIAPHAQPRAKPETLPPDLNIGFQSPGSPGRPSSGVKLDSQQPDLALQL